MGDARDLGHSWTPLAMVVSGCDGFWPSATCHWNGVVILAMGDDWTRTNHGLVSCRPMVVVVGW